MSPWQTDAVAQFRHPSAAKGKNVLHRAARIENRIQEFREKRARKRGFKETIIPYAGYGTTQWVRVLGRVLLTKSPRPDARASDNRTESIRGWRSFTSVPVPDVSVTIEIGGIIHQVHADRGGVIDAVVPTGLQPGTHTVSLATEESHTVDAAIFVINPSMSMGVVSDVDDTVMVTALPRPLLAAWNTFVLDEHARIPTPGMAVFMERIAAKLPGVPFFYLSTGAWNVAPTLTRFLSRNLYPAGALLLTDWGPTHDRLFRSGREHKRESLRRLASEFPTMKWLLIGDDGQHDEEIYAEFARENPESVTAIAIRQLSPGQAVLAGGRSTVDSEEKTHGVPWVYAPDGAGLSEKLRILGVL